MIAASVEAPAAQLGLELGADENDRPAPVAEPMSVTDRRALVAVLYPEETTVQLGRRFGVSSTTIGNDLRALGIARAPRHRRTTNPIPEERPCAHCGELFTPKRRDREGKFCRRACSDAGREATPIRAHLTLAKLRDRCVDLYVLEGCDYEETAARVGVTAMTVWKHVRAAGYTSRRQARYPVHVKGEWRACLDCGRVRWVYASQFETREMNRCRPCAGVYAWWKTDQFRPLVESWPWGRARQRWLGRWGLAAVRDEGRHAKGRREAAKTLARALLLIDRKPDLTRKELIDLLIRAEEGRDALFSPEDERRAPHDPVYHAARKRTVRRLERGFEDAGRPRQLAHLL